VRLDMNADVARCHALAMGAKRKRSKGTFYLLFIIYFPFVKFVMAVVSLFR